MDRNPYGKATKGLMAFVPDGLRLNGDGLTISLAAVFIAK
jgi:hypothetical protein